jgi:hypothetical protein
MDSILPLSILMEVRVLEHGIDVSNFIPFSFHFGVQICPKNGKARDPTELISGQ